MKEITEEMQMRIFDLLEGNLSPTEEKVLLEEINRSPHLRREYELMSKTYLVQDEEDHSVLFPEKNRLYRRPGLFVTVNRRMLYPIAASVAILATGFVSWYIFQAENPALTNVASKSVTSSPAATGGTQKSPGNTSVDTGSPNTETADIANPSVFYTATKTTSKSDSQNVERKTRPVPTPVFIKHPEAKEENPPAYVNIENIPDTPSQAAALNGPVPTAKKRSLSYKLLHGGRAMLANLQLPDIRLITEKKSNKAIPSVKMAISTYKTDVIATIIE